MSEKSTEKAVTRHSGKKLKVFGKLLHKKARDGKMSMVSHLDEFRKRVHCLLCRSPCGLLHESRLAGHRADGARQELSVRLYLTDRADHVLCAHCHDRRCRDRRSGDYL